jgi:predicted ribosomally synthesized peptide with SipW-like signal peptide
MPATPPLPGRRVRVLRGVLALGVVVGLGATATLASWADSGSQADTFSTGTIDLRFDGTTSTSPTGLATLSFTDASPGASVIKRLTVNNVGTLPLTYNMSVTTSTTTATDLASALQLTIVTGTSPAHCNATEMAAGTTGGNVLLDGVPLNTASLTNQSIAASGSQALCMYVEMPSTTPGSMQGMGTSAVFAFSAAAA